VIERTSWTPDHCTSMRQSHTGLPNPSACGSQAQAGLSFEAMIKVEISLTLAWF